MQRNSIETTYISKELNFALCLYKYSEVQFGYSKHIAPEFFYMSAIFLFFPGRQLPPAARERILPVSLFDAVHPHLLLPL